MSQTPSTLKVAYELANRLGEVFCSNAFLLRRSAKDISAIGVAASGWSAVTVEGNARDIDSWMALALQSFDTKSNQPLLVRRDGDMLAIISIGEDHADTIAVGIVIPDQNEGLVYNQALVCSVISAHLEALQQRSEVEATKVQIVSFIDQVTQDFEELTWLRNANEFMDICGSKHTLESIAEKCLPDLVHVVRAEAIYFIPAKRDGNSDSMLANWECVIAAGRPYSDFGACYRLLNESMHCLTDGPHIFNVTTSQEHIPGFPGIVNCIAIAVAKGTSVYGWLMAINRISTVEPANLDCGEFAEIAPSFGTFEAGLVSAAASIMSSHARNLELFKAQESLTIGVVRAIINAIDAKDNYTCGHSDRVAMYSKKIAARLTLDDDECERIYMAGLLHDVGKIGIPDSILSKPGKLTDEEYAIVKKHPEIGHNILAHLTQLSYVLPGVLYHHEAVNGTGYPAGLVGEAIPLHGRILAVADAYDAMTSNRPYRAGMPSEKAESIMRAESGKTWDPDIVVALLECLANGEIQPHSTDANTPLSDSVCKSDANASLMNRIGCSINCLALG